MAELFLGGGLLFAQVPEWKVVVDLRLNSADGPASFTDVRGVSVTPSGDILVLDSKDQEVRMFSRTGSYLRTVARKGSGPGELRAANGMQHLEDGSSVIIDPGGEKIVVLDPTGAFQFERRVSGLNRSRYWDGRVLPSGTIIERARQPLPADEWGRPPAYRHYRIVQPNGKADTIAYPACGGEIPSTRQFAGTGGGRGPVIVEVPFTTSGMVIADSKGRVWCSPLRDYEIRRYDSAADASALRLRKSISLQKIPDVRRDSALARVRQLLADYQQRDFEPKRVPLTYPALSAIALDARDRLYACRPIEPSKNTVCDIYTETGLHLASLRLPFLLASGTRTVITNDEIMSVDFDQDDVPHVIRARLVRP
jgi:hypothetical protein